MSAGKTLFSEPMDCLPWSTFARIVARYHGDHSVQTFPCSEPYQAMAFAQLTYRESLRGIDACLSAQPASSGIWVFADRSAGQRWRMPIRSVTGTFTLNSGSGRSHMRDGFSA